MSANTLLWLTCVAIGVLSFWLLVQFNRADIKGGADSPEGTNNDLLPQAVASRVQQIVTRNYYDTLLQALQADAGRYGYVFASSKPASAVGEAVNISELPVFLIEEMSEAVQQAKYRYIAPLMESPKMGEMVQREMDDGGATALMTRLLGALEELQFRLYETEPSKQLIEDAAKWKASSSVAEPSSPVVVAKANNPLSDDFMSLVEEITDTANKKQH